MRYNPIKWIMETIKEPSPKKDVLFAYVMTAIAAIGAVIFIMWVYSLL